MWYEWVNTAQSCTTFTRAPLHAFLLLPYHPTQSTSHPTQFCPHSAPPAPLLRPAPPLSPPRYHFDKEIAMLRKLKRKAMMWQGAFDAGVQLNLTGAVGEGFGVGLDMVRVAHVGSKGRRWGFSGPRAVDGPRSPLRQGHRP